MGFKSPRVVLLYGAGSGFGKSTLVAELVRQLEAQGFNVTRFPEESVLESSAFRTYVQQVEVGKGDDTRTLLASCQEFIHSLVMLDADIIVLDSILPCWNWLYSAGADDAAVLTFTKVLHGYFEGLSPVLVLLEGDLERALDRATKDRGLDWALDVAEQRTGQCTLSALGQYFDNLRSGTERMLPGWQYPIVSVDTVACDLEGSFDQIHRGLSVG